MVLILGVIGTEEAANKKYTFAKIEELELREKVRVCVLDRSRGESCGAAVRSPVVIFHFANGDIRDIKRKQGRRWMPWL